MSKVLRPEQREEKSKELSTLSLEQREEERRKKDQSSLGKSDTTLPRLGTGSRVLRRRELGTIAIVALGGTAADWPRMWHLWKTVEEVWTINMGCFAVRSDLNFSCHTLATMLGEEDPLWTDPHANLEDNIKSNIELVEMLAASPVPQVTLDGSYGSYEYPFAEICAEFGESYFMNGLAYMIAYAMYCGVKKIYCVGWEFEVGPKAMEQGRASVEWWTGFAQARGVTFFFPGTTTFQDVAKRRTMGLYGFGYQQPTFIDGKPREFKSLSFDALTRLQGSPLWQKLSPYLPWNYETVHLGELYQKSPDQSPGPEPYSSPSSPQPSDSPPNAGRATRR